MTRPQTSRPATADDFVVLVVEDDEALNRLIRRRLERRELCTAGVGSGAAALAWLAESGRTASALLLIDFKLGDMAADELIAAFDELPRRPEFIIMTGQGSERVAVEMLKAGARDYLTKEADFLELLPQVVCETRDRIITERRLARVEEELRSSEERFRNLFHNTADALFIHAADGRVLEANRTAERMLGYDRRQLVGMTPRDLVVAGRADDVEARLRELPTSGGVIFETDYRRGDGGVLPIEVNARRMEYAGEQCFITVCRDISERLESERALREAYRARRELEQIVNQSEAVIFLWRNQPGLPVEFVSDNVAMYGYSAADWRAGLSFTAIIHPADRERVTAEVFEHLRAGRDEFSQLYRLVTREGEVRWVDDRTIVRRDAAGRVTHFQGILLDISERRRAEEALADSEREKSAILAAMEESVVYYTPDLVVRWANRAAADSLGLEPAELIGRSCDQLWFTEATSPERPVVTARRSGADCDAELSTPDGRRLHLTGHPVYDEDGKLLGLVEVGLDITEQHRYQEALAESERRFAAFMDYLPAAVFIKDPEGRNLFLNRYQLEHIGRESWLGETLFDHLPPERAAVVQENDRRAFADGYVSGIEVLPDHDGNLRTFDTHKFVIELAGERRLLGGVALDITERHRMERELAESRRRLETLMENLPGMAYRCLFNDNWTMLFVSGGGFSLTGYRPEQLVDDAEIAFVELIHPEDRYPLRRAINDAIERRSYFQATFRLRTAEDEERWAWVQGVPTFDNGGELKFLEGFITDVTAERRAGEELRRRAVAMESTLEGMAILDERERYIYLNAAHVRIYGYDDPEELLGRSWRVLYDDEALQRFDKEIMPALHSDGHWSGEAVGLRSDGEHFPQEVSLTALDDGGLVCVVRDITERELAEELERREAMIAQIQQIFSTIRHEMGNTLNTLKTSLKVLQNNLHKLGPDRLEFYLKLSLETFQVAERLLGTLREYQRFDELLPGPVRIDDFLLAKGALLRENAANRGVQTELRLQAPDAVTNIDGDALFRILINLTENAVSACAEVDNPRIEISSRAVEGWVLLRVRDNGTGIAPEHLPHVFTPLFTTKKHGSGLGLAVVQKLVQQMGGRVAVQSRLGEGTTLTLHLPRQGPRTSLPS